MYNMQSLILRFEKGFPILCTSGQVNTLYSHIHGVFHHFFFFFLFFLTKINDIDRSISYIACFFVFLSPHVFFLFLYIPSYVRLNMKILDGNSQQL